MRIQISNFQGRVPRISNVLLEGSKGTTVMNCNLDSGEIRSTRFPDITATLVDYVGADTFINYDSKWVMFDDAVDVHPGFLTADSNLRMYYTKQGANPKRFIKTGVTEAQTGVYKVTTDYDLGLPAPENAATLGTSGSGSGTSYTRYYVYTYVSELSEEGPPSPVSSPVTWQTGITVNLSGLDTAPVGDYNVQYKRIYRSISGTSATSFQLVAQIPIADATFSDTVADNALGVGLPSATWIKPPTGMQGLIPMPGGFFAGFSNKTICFSEPLYPHAWPYGYRINVDYNVIGLGSNGNTLVVLTESKPYIINIPHPSQFSMTKYNEIIPCISKESIVNTVYGVFFASSDGLYLAGSGGIQKITSDLFTRREWNAINPSTLKAAYFDSKYFGFTNNTTFYFEPLGQDRTIKNLNVIANACRVTDTNSNLYYLTETDTNTIINEYEGTLFTQNAQWKSKTYLTDLVNFAAAQVFAEYPSTLTEAEWEAAVAGLVESIITQANGEFRGAVDGHYINEVPINGSILDAAYVDYTIPELINFNLYADGVLIYSTSIVNNEPFPLPAIPNARKWEVEITSKGVNVQELLVATSFEELSMQAETLVLT